MAVPLNKRPPAVRKLTKEQILNVRKNADALLKKMESEEKDAFKKVALSYANHQSLLERIAGKLETDSSQERLYVAIKGLQEDLKSVYSSSRSDYAQLGGSLQELGKIFSGKRDFNDSSLLGALSKIEKQITNLANKKVEAPTVQDRSEDVIKAIVSLGNKISDLKVEFPKVVDVGNFPPQMVPQPVTKVAIRGGGTTDLEATVRELTNANALNVAVVDANGDQITNFGGGGGGGGTQYNVGTVAGATDTGTLALLVRDDTLGTLSDADGDYVQGRTNSRGALWVQHDGAISAAQSGTWVLGSNSGVDIGDVTINNASGASAVNIQDGGNTITVDGTITANAGTNLNTSALLTTAAHDAAFGTAGSADTQVRSIQGISGMTPVQIGDNSASISVDWNGTQPVTGSGTATGALRVELPTNGTGVIATVGTVTTLTGTTTLTPGTGATNLGKAEDGAHTSGDVGVMDLAVRNDTMADFTGADNDYTPKAVTLKGQQLTANAPRARKVFQVTTITASTSETTVLTAAASTFHDVYGVIVTNTSATATEVAFKDDTAGTTRFTISAPANDTRGFMLPIDAAHNASATNDNWTATCADSVSSILITVFAVKNL